MPVKCASTTEECAPHLRNSAALDAPLSVRSATAARGTLPASWAPVGLALQCAMLDQRTSYWPRSSTLEPARGPNAAEPGQLGAKRAQTRLTRAQIDRRAAAVPENGSGLIGGQNRPASTTRYASKWSISDGLPQCLKVVSEEARPVPRPEMQECTQQLHTELAICGWAAKMPESGFERSPIRRKSLVRREAKTGPFTQGFT